MYKYKYLNCYKMKFNVKSLENMEVTDFISRLIYTSQMKSNFLQHYELENLSLELYSSLKTLQPTGLVENTLTLLRILKNHNFIILNDYKIHIHDKCFLKLALLISLRHCKELFNKKDTTIIIQDKQEILHKCMLAFQADKIDSIHILCIIENIIKKNKNVVDSELALQLVLFSQKVAVSPLEGFKYYAQNISKIAIPLLCPEDLKVFLDLNFLPIWGIESLELVPYFKNACTDKENIGNIARKVLKMFLNNIENREGGFLYKSLLFEDFCEWKDLVWPSFYAQFQINDFEGEFFHSLVKYWIPQTVSAYKLKFYEFVCTTHLPTYLKGYILLETRRKGFIEVFDKDTIQFLKSLLSDETTSNLALKILSSYFKKTLYPSELELNLVKRVIFVQIDPLDNEELKCLHRFLSQIGVVGSELLNSKVLSITEKILVNSYKNFVTEIFRVCLQILKTSRKDFGAQMLVLLWKLKDHETPYILNYKIEKVLMGFYENVLPQEDVYCECVEKALLQDGGYCLELTKLGRLVLSSSKFYSNENLLRYIDESDKIFIKAAESVRNVASITVAQNNAQKNILLLQKLYDAIGNLFQTFSLTLTSIFKGVLLFEAILEISKQSNESCTFEGFDIYYVAVIENILRNDIVDQIYQQELKKTSEQHNCPGQKHNRRSKIQKLLEALLNNMLQYILQDPNVYELLDKPKVMNLLIKIIETSNMRRSTTLSADVLKHIAIKIDKENELVNSNINTLKRKSEETYFKIHLLHNTIQKLCKASSVQNLTIRRNPESRLIIHALCASDQHPQKPLLNETLHSLLRILTDAKSTDSTLSSAFHCTEILISDNTLYNHTLKFVPNVIIQCVQHFKNRSWIVRNADIQLARAIIDRFFGVLIAHNNRPKSVEDLLILFPQLTKEFCRVLSYRPLTDSSVIVMQFFSESQAKRQAIENSFMKVIREIFLRLFMKIVIENCDHFGIFGVRAYTSLSLEQEIPNIIREIVDFVIANFDYIRQKHTIGNFVLLLNELYNKYLSSVDDLVVKPAEYFIIHASFDSLSMFLRHYNTRQFDLLLLKVLSTNEVLETVKSTDFDRSAYTQRLWQHNYICMLTINSNNDQISEILKDILSKNILDCVQIKVLSILVDKYSKKQLTSENIENIFVVLVQKMLNIECNKAYLLLCYFKVIFLFFKTLKNFEIKVCILNEMRRCYRVVQNIYKTFVVVMLLTRFSEKTEVDRKFIITAIKCFQNLDIQDFELAEIVSETLPYLYLNVGCICDKYRVFKIAVFLILEHGLWDFVCFINKSKISNPLIALVQILDCKVLTNSLESDQLALKFIKEFYCLITENNTKKADNVNTTYYVEEKVMFLDEACINKIVLKFLYDLNKKNQNFEWFRYYESLQNKTKDDL